MVISDISIVNEKVNNLTEAVGMAGELHFVSAAETTDVAVQRESSAGYVSAQSMDMRFRRIIKRDVERIRSIGTEFQKMDEELSKNIRGDF